MSEKLPEPSFIDALQEYRMSGGRIRPTDFARWESACQGVELTPTQVIDVGTMRTEYALALYDRKATKGTVDAIFEAGVSDLLAVTEASESTPYEKAKAYGMLASANIMRLRSGMGSIEASKSLAAFESFFDRGMGFMEAIMKGPMGSAEKVLVQSIALIAIINNMPGKGTQRFHASPMPPRYYDGEADPKDGWHISVWDRLGMKSTKVRVGDKHPGQTNIAFDFSHDPVTNRTDGMVVPEAVWCIATGGEPSQDQIEVISSTRQHVLETLEVCFGRPLPPKAAIAVALRGSVVQQQAGLLASGLKPPNAGRSVPATRVASPRASGRSERVVTAQERAATVKESQDVPPVPKISLEGVTTETVLEWYQGLCSSLPLNAETAATLQKLLLPLGSTKRREALSPQELLSLAQMHMECGLAVAEKDKIGATAGFINTRQCTERAVLLLEGASQLEAGIAHDLGVPALEVVTGCDEKALSDPRELIASIFDEVISEQRRATNKDDAKRLASLLRPLLASYVLSNNQRVVMPSVARYHAGKEVVGPDVLAWEDGALKGLRVAPTPKGARLAEGVAFLPGKAMHPEGVRAESLIKGIVSLSEGKLPPEKQVILERRLAKMAKEAARILERAQPLVG